MNSGSKEKFKIIISENWVEENWLQVISEFVNRMIESAATNKVTMITHLSIDALKFFMGEYLKVK